MAIEKSRPPRDRGSPRPSVEPPAQPGGVQVRERNGIWEVRDNGVFRGDYHQKEHALAVAALLRARR